MVQTRLMTEQDQRGTVASATAHQKLVAIEKRLTELQEGAGRRREQLAGLHVQQDSGNQEFLAEGVPEGWES